MHNKTICARYRPLSFSAIYILEKIKWIKIKETKNENLIVEAGTKGEGMNTQNFASLEASKKLHDAGVKLKTDCVWCPKSLIPTQSEEWILITNARFNREYYDFDPCVPAPSMVEVWRELPDSTCINKDGDYTKCWVDSNMSLKVFQNENPTDALIDLLIWVKEKKQRTQ